jgi:asparagine synthase (glutamine-hydrolysing)
MCGIFGFWQPDSLDWNRQTLCRATTALRHRGPDDEGYLLVDTATGRWVEAAGDDTIPEVQRPRLAELPSEERYNLAFGFRRLSILDLSPAGHQPMGTPGGQLWIVYNGEIYNYIELRAELQALGCTFATRSDTEVILHAYRQWGEACLRRFNGMWAFAIWDAARQRLFCSRDRFGIKPFYYYRTGRSLAFASEIKALLELPGVPRQPNDGILYDYLSANQIDHTAETFFEGIEQLPPAHYLVVDAGSVSVHRYWDLPKIEQTLPGPDIGYAQTFAELLTDAVRLHLRSDVAIGTCLSGGLDSSTIVCLVERLLAGTGNPDLPPGERLQKTFSACAEDLRFDERRFIEPVLQATGAERNFVFPHPSRLLDDLPRLIYHQDEPFGSLSIYAQWCVMALAHEGRVKVLLDGQGGDELLGGYHSYFDYFWAGLLGRGHWGLLLSEWAAYRRIYRASPWSVAAHTLRPFAPAWAVSAARRLKRGGGLGMQVLGLNPDFARRYRRRRPEAVPLRPDPFRNALYDSLTRSSLPKLLHYEDRNSMAHSIEARVPFLDYRLAEFAFQLPPEQKIHHGLTKVVLRQALQGTLPEVVRARTDKMGFVTPEKEWLATALKPWLEELFNSASFRSRPYFNPGEIQSALQAHARGQVDLTALAWRWANLEFWLRQMVDAR